MTQTVENLPLARYQRMSAQVAACIPGNSQVVLLADRGFMDVKLMRLIRQLGWHFRIRVKLSVFIHRATKGKRKEIKEIHYYTKTNIHVKEKSPAE